MTDFSDDFFEISDLLSYFEKKLKKFLRTTKGKRVDFSTKVKAAVKLRQQFRCNGCDKAYPHLQFHHKDGDRTNNMIWNCEALCPNCHDMKTRKKRKYNYEF